MITYFDLSTSDSYEIHYKLNFRNSGNGTEVTSMAKRVCCSDVREDKCKGDANYMEG